MRLVPALHSRVRSAQPRAADGGALSPPPDPFEDFVLRERRQISRDLHDSLVQPYLGLRWALEACLHKLTARAPIEGDIHRLIERVDEEILAVRRYLEELRAPHARHPTDLGTLLCEQLAFARERYALQVTLAPLQPILVSQRLASAVLHLINEALSNIRRHTDCVDARIELIRQAQHLRIEVSNPLLSGKPAPVVLPRSIAERAQACVGDCSVRSLPGQQTTVSVGLPWRY